MTFPQILAAHGAPAGDTGAIENFASQVYPAILESLEHFGPEVKVAVAAMVILLLDLLIPLKYSKHLAWAAIVACLLPLGDIAHHYEEKGSLFLGMTAMDSFASFFKVFFLLGSIPVILLSYISKQLEGRRMGEYYFILLAFSVWADGRQDARALAWMHSHGSWIDWIDDATAA